MVFDETMNNPDFESKVTPLPEAAMLEQLSLIPLWNDYSPGGQGEGLPFLFFDDEDGEDDEEMGEEESFDDMDDDFDDDFDDDEDDFGDDDYEEEDDDYDYEEDVDYDDFDE